MDERLARLERWLRTERDSAMSMQPSDDWDRGYASACDAALRKILDMAVTRSAHPTPAHEKE
jgi:hypothetical protein